MPPRLDPRRSSHSLADDACTTQRRAGPPARVGGASRNLFGLACLCVLALAAILGGNASSAGAANPVPGPSGANPDDRHYELVTQADSGGASLGIAQQSSELVPKRHGAAAPDGESLLFAAPSGVVPGSNANRSKAVYLSHRTATGWSAEYAGAPGDRVTLAPLFLVSEDLSHLFFGVGLAGNSGGSGVLDPDDPGDGTDIYARNPDGSFTWTSRASLSTAGDNATDFVSSSPDGSTQLFYGNGTLALEPLATPNPANPANSSLYAAGSAHAEVISILPSGEGAPSDYGLPSRDGSRVVFRAFSGPFGSDRRVYVRLRDQAQTVEASAPTTGVDTAQDVFPVSVSADADVVYFSTTQKLTADDTDFSLDLYRYTLDASYDFDTATPAPTLTRVSKSSPGAADDGNSDACTSEYGTPQCDISPVLTSPDGSSTYFLSPERLVAGAVAGKPNLYLSLDGAAPSLVAVLDPQDAQNNGPNESRNLAGLEYNRPARIADEGSLAFESRAQLTSYENSGVAELYLYDIGSGEIFCGSCRVGGPIGPNAEALLRSPSAGGFYRDAGRNLTDGAGELYFDTTERLVPEDTNGLSDVYQYKRAAGRISLVSSGNGSRGAFYMDSATDGQDVFVLTRDSFLPGDLNRGIAKIYDARTGGGFPTETPAAGCSGDSCQGPVTPAPSEQNPASASIASPGNAKHHRRNHKKRGKHKKHRHRRQAQGGRADR